MPCAVVRVVCVACVFLALYSVNHAEVVQRLGEGRVDAQGGSVALDGLLEVVPVLVDDAQVVEGLAAERVEVDRQLIADDRCMAVR